MASSVKWLITLFCVYLGTQTCVSAYKPVVMIHGILSTGQSLFPMAERIKQFHPGTEVYVTTKFENMNSLDNMMLQVKEIGDEIMNLSAQHPEGINLIGYSQGGLIARAILEFYPNHTVDTFISLSSPQGGQYGTKFLHLYFPGLVCYSAYELFYSDIGQHISVANYWNDPLHHDLYLKYNFFLPYINNEIETTNSNSYKQGITKLNKMVLIGGPDDGVITPWQSSQFGYYDANENVVDLRNQDAYIKDKLGLKTLDKRKKLTVIVQNGVEHKDWHSNKTVIDNYIIPYLT